MLVVMSQRHIWQQPKHERCRKNRAARDVHHYVYPFIVSRSLPASPARYFVEWSDLQETVQEIDM